MEQAIFSGTVNEYHVKVASTVYQAKTLIEAGLDYVTGEYDDGGKIVGKQK